MKSRYFEGDHPALERRLEEHFSRVSHAFITAGWRGALVLGGGYGRGEGGVMKGPEGDGFSNDLDYFLFDDAPDEPRLATWCRDIEREESELLGIDVEIKRLSASSMGDPNLSMMFADLVAGHVTVAGDAGFLLKMRADLDFKRIPAEEATRLLWNRGSGMFFSRCRMGVDAQKPFVIRNHAKLKLALGDAWLCLHGGHSPRCRERAARLLGMDVPETVPQLREWHAQGVEFKFHPFADGPSWAELEQEARQLTAAWAEVYLAAEAFRLRRGFGGFSDYLRLPRLLRHAPLGRNLGLALRDRIKRGAYLRPLGDYPRAGLMRALPCLLDLTSGGVREAGRFLPKPPGDPDQPVSWEATYARWWACYA